MRNTLPAMFAGVLVLSLVGCGGLPTQPRTAGGPQTQQVTLEHGMPVAVTVLAVHQPSGGPASVEYRITNVGTAVVTPDLLDFTSVVDEQGKKAQPMRKGDFPETELLADIRLAPGDTVDGQLSYQLPGGADVDGVTFTPGGEGAKGTAHWRAQDIPANVPADTSTDHARQLHQGDAAELIGTDEDENPVHVHATMVGVLNPAPASYKPYQAGDKMIAVRFALRNDASVPFTDALGTMIDTVYDSDHHVYELDEPIPADTTTDLFAMTIAPGDTATGLVVFDVPPNTKLVDVQLAVDDAKTLSGLAQWAL